jgi:hypothetical protein
MIPIQALDSWRVVDNGGGRDGPEEGFRASVKAGWCGESAAFVERCTGHVAMSAAKID